MQATYEQCLLDQQAEWQHRDHDAHRASTSLNLELEFMEVSGHRVFNTPYANIYALGNEMAAIQNPTEEQ